MSPIDPHSCSNALASRLLGCSANPLSVLAGKGIVPREKRGRYDLLKAVPAFIAHRKGENEATRGEVIGKHRVVQERIRKLRIENNRTEPLEKWRALIQLAAKCRTGTLKRSAPR